MPLRDHADHVGRRVPDWPADLLEIEPDRSARDEVISAVIDSAARISPLSVVVISNYHRAYRGLGKTDTAYYRRDLPYDIIAANWVDPAGSDGNVRWRESSSWR
jgi:hypothetical protein